ncbi:MAG: cell division protein FtsZ [Fimbriimonadaceae bacterium]|nr:cell division protein FtsZ [Chitinophagales bacterium]
MYFDLPKEQTSIIKVIGVGGGGCNAVNHMFDQGIKDVNFVICNTDAQVLDMSTIPVKIQLGPTLTKGRGAGSHPHMGREAAMESLQELKSILEKNTEMVFITAGMGGGTGTGGAPVIAKLAKEMGILTIAIVTLPFNFEGRRRKTQADDGLEELKRNVDAILIVSNDKLREIYGNLPWKEAFAHADDILSTAAKGIAEIITVPGYINVDFEDVKTVLRDSGLAIMGSGKSTGQDRAINAVKSALESPLLNDSDIRGAKSILLNITSGTDPVLMDEISEITEFVQQAAGNDCDIIWGNCTDETIGDHLMVTVIATGFETEEERRIREKSKKVVVSHLDAKDYLKHKKQVDADVTTLPEIEKKQEIKIELITEEKKVIKEDPKQFVFEFNNDLLGLGFVQIKESVEEQNKITSSAEEKVEEIAENNIENFPAEEIKDEAPLTEYIAEESIPEFPLNDLNITLKEETKDIKPEPVTYYRKEEEPVIHNDFIRNEDKMDFINKNEDDRVKRLKSMSMKLNNLEELEKVPAYLRRDVELKDVPKSQDVDYSKFTVQQTENDGLEIKKNNPFLHDNVD